MAETTSNQYQDQVLEAMDQLIADRLSKAQFDRTYLCKIVEVSDTTTKDKKYRYSLEYEEGSRTFVLYDEKKYYKNSYVWVSVPQSDWDGDGKRIVREYTKDDDNFIVYRNYDNGMVKVDIKPGTGLENTTITLTNDSAQHRNKIGFITFDDILLFDEPYTTIGVKAYFQTSTELINKQGNYGLGLSLYSDDSREDFQYLCRLDSSLFLGDPYNLVEVAFPFSQMFKSLEGKKFSIQDLSGKTIYLYLYQNGNFIDTNKTITVSNIEVSLGYLVNEISKEPGVKIYLDNSNGYNKSTDYDELNRNFRLGFFFFYNDDNQILRIYKNTVPSNYSIKWYRYRIGDGDIGGGIYYGEIQNIGDNLLTLNGTEKTIKIKDDDTYTATLPELNKTYENIEIVISNSDSFLEKYTNSITLNNTNIKPELDNEDGILITFDNLKYENVTDIYGNDNHIFENHLKITATAPLEDIDLTEYLVEWIIPKKSTMIQELRGEGLIKTEQEDSIVYTQAIDTIKKVTIDFKEVYNSASSNNTIKCICTSKKIEGTKKINIGTYGSNGTEYSFNAFFESNWALKTIPGSTINGQLHLTKNGEDILRQSLLSDLTITFLNLPLDAEYDISRQDNFHPLDESVEDSPGYLDFTLVWNTNLEENDIKFYFYVLNFTLANFININNRLNLNTYLQIPILLLSNSSIYNENYRFQGATRIVYNMIGTNASLSTESYPDTIISLENQDNNVYYLNDKKQIIIPKIYSDSLTKKKYYFIDEINTGNYCIYPLLIIQNNYESTIINNWDGEFKLDENENYILSSLIGAGYKTNTNKFTGVIMGTVGTQLTNAKTGLYGFNDSNRVFELNEDGELFIGSADKGTLEFNPDTGLSINLKGSGITSAQEFSFNKNDGLVIKAKNFSVDKDGNVILGHNDNLGKIYAGSGIIGGWDILDTRIESDRTSSDGYRCGMQNLDVASSAVFYAGCTTTAGGGIASEEYTKFFVTQNGEMHAIKGKIGSWNIGDVATKVYPNSLYSTCITTSGQSVSTSNPEYLVLLRAEGGADTLAIGVRKRTSSSTVWDTADLQFGVNKKGHLVANDASIKGTIQAETVLGSGFNITNSTGGTKGAGLFLGNSTASGQSAVGFSKEYLSARYRGDTYEDARWYAVVFVANEWDDGSDRRLKNTINTFADKYEVFFDNLNPVTFKYNNGKSNRTHSGFIAQEIVGALEQAGLTIQDFAAPCLTRYVDEENYWHLRKDEFIALNTWQIQKLKARVSQLEAQLREKGVIDNNETN